MSTMTDLEKILNCLRAANVEGTIVDTIWMNDHQTLFDFIESCIEEAALTQQQEAEPVAWILTGTDSDLVPRRYLLFSGREADLHVSQNLAGGEWQSCAAKPLFLHPPKPAAQPQVPEWYFLLNRDESNMAIWNAVRNIKFGNRDDDKLIVAELNKLGFFVCRRSAAKEEGK